MAEQIARPHVYGNFRPSVSERAAKKPTAQQQREGNSDAHRKLIKLLPCCVTGKYPPNDGHHLKSGPAAKERGIGCKATDKWLVPLCREKHDELEVIGSRRELSWFREQGVSDPIDLAAALWNATGDLSKMTKIVHAHMGKSSR